MASTRGNGGSRCRRPDCWQERITAPRAGGFVVIYDEMKARYLERAGERATILGLAEGDYIGKKKTRCRVVSSGEPGLGQECLSAISRIGCLCP